MSENGMADDEKLKKAFAASEGGSVPAAGCPGDDLIWSAVQGELESERIEAILAHSLDCAACELSLRMAAGMSEELAATGAAGARADASPSISAEHAAAEIVRFPMRRRLAFVLGAVAAALLVTIALPTLLRRTGAPPPRGSFESAVATTFWRAAGGGDEPLADGDAIRPGDRLYMTVKSAEPVYLYVINRDEAGEASVLFPIEASQHGNPLQPGVSLRIPGETGWDYDSWEVSSAGGRDAFIVVASREPIQRLQTALDRLAAAAPLDPDGIVRGGDPGGPDVPPVSADGALTLDNILRDLAASSAESEREVILRRIVLENPR